MNLSEEDINKLHCSFCNKKLGMENIYGYDKYFCYSGSEFTHTVLQYYKGINSIFFAKILLLSSKMSDYNGNHRFAITHIEYSHYSSNGFKIINNIIEIHKDRKTYISEVISEVNIDNFKLLIKDNKIDINLLSSKIMKLSIIQ